MGSCSGLFLRKIFVGEGSQGSGLGGSCCGGRSSGGSDRGGRAGSCIGKRQVKWIIYKYQVPLRQIQQLQSQPQVLPLGPRPL